MPSDSDSDNEQVHARDHAAEVALCPAAAAAQAAAAASAGRIQPGPSRSPAQVRVPRPSPRTAIAPAATATSAAAAEAAAIAVEMTARLAVGGCKPKPGHRPVSKKPAAAPGVTAAAAVSLQDGSGSAAPVAKGGSAASAGTMGCERPASAVSNISKSRIASTSGPKECAGARAGPTLPMAEHVAVAASSVQQEAAMMAANTKTFASRWPPNEEKLKGATAAWDAMVLGFCMEKVEARIAGRKRSMSQKEWWNMYGHTVSEAKQRKTLKKPSASASSRVREEGEDAEAPPVSAEEDEHKEDDEEKGEESDVIE